MTQYFLFPHRLITKEDAQTALAPIHAPLYDSFEAAWNRWKTKLSEHFARPRRALQISMNDLAEQELRMRLGSTPDVTLSDPEGDRFWIELPAVLVSIKKFKHGFAISHYQTGTAEAFLAQQDLPGVPPLPRVHAGYFVTNTRDQLAGIHVALLTGRNKCSWNYQLERDPGSGGIVIGSEYPILPLTPRELTLKPSAERKKKDGNT